VFMIAGFIVSVLEFIQDFLYNDDIAASRLRVALWASAIYALSTIMLEASVLRSELVAMEKVLRACVAAQEANSVRA
jgi:hypothetical protein